MFGFTRPLPQCVLLTTWTVCVSMTLQWSDSSGFTHTPTEKSAVTCDDISTPLWPSCLLSSHAAGYQTIVSHTEHYITEILTHVREQSCSENNWFMLPLNPASAKGHLVQDWAPTVNWRRETLLLSSRYKSQKEMSGFLTGKYSTVQLSSSELPDVTLPGTDDVFNTHSSFQTSLTLIKADR